MKAWRKNSKAKVMFEKIKKSLFVYEVERNEDGEIEVNYKGIFFSDE